MTLTIYRADASTIAASPKQEMERCAETQTIDLAKPVFICAGGIETNELKIACGYMRMLAKLLGVSFLKDEGVTFYPLAYAEKMPEKKDQVLKEYTGEECRTPTGKEEANQCGKMLVKAISGQLPDAVGLSGGVRDECKRKTARMLRNLNFFGFSFGTLVATGLHTQLFKELMNNKHFSEIEAKELMRNVKVLTLGEMDLWQHKPDAVWNFTSLHVASGTDALVNMVSPIDLKQTPHVMAFGKHANPNKANELLMLVNLQLRNESGQIDKSGHMLKTYVNDDFPLDSENEFTRCVAQTVLRNYLLASRGTTDMMPTIGLLNKPQFDVRGVEAQDTADRLYLEKLREAVKSAPFVWDGWAKYVTAVQDSGNVGHAGGTP